MSVLAHHQLASPSLNLNSGQTSTQPSNSQRNNRVLSNLTTFWIGLNRKQCIDIAHQEQFKVTNFAHWLYLHELGLVLSFRHQQCIEVGKVLT